VLLSRTPIETQLLSKNVTSIAGLISSATDQPWAVAHLDDIFFTTPWDNEAVLIRLTTYGAHFWSVVGRKCVTSTRN
jgi:hypothetical protein